MDNFTKWLLSVITGALAAFFGQYGLFIVLVAVAVVLDVVTGLIKAKATGEGRYTGDNILMAESEEELKSLLMKVKE